MKNRPPSWGGWWNSWDTDWNYYNDYDDYDNHGDNSGGGGPTTQPPQNTPVDGKSAETDECNAVGNPIVRSTGNKIEPEQDFTTSGEMPLTLDRTYNHYWQGAGLFGKHWVSSFDYKLTFGTTALNSCYPRPGGGACGIGTNTVIYAWRPDGRTIKYTKAADGFYYEDKPGPLSKIEQLADGRFALRYAQGGYEMYSSSGYISFVQSRSAVRWTFSYTNGTYPYRVTHTSGRYVEFTWTNGQLAAVRDPAGNLYGFSYTPNAFGTGLHRLAASSQPGAPGTNVTYHYELSSDSSALTGKSYNGVRYSTFTYDASGYATSSHHNNLDKYTFAYTPAADGKLTVVETNPLGKRTTYVYVNGNISTVTGHPSTNCPATMYALTEYDANGYPSMASDFNGNDTSYTYNAQGQLLKKIEGYGTPAARTTTYEWYGASEDNRIFSITVAGISRTEYYYSANGRPSRIMVRNLTSNGVPNQERNTWFYYSYHTSGTNNAISSAANAPGTGGNLPPMALGMLAVMRVDTPVSRGVDEIKLTYDTFGNLLTAKDQLDHGPTYSGHNALGLPARSQGANGAIADYLYDARGRLFSRKEIVNGQVYTTSYAYDGFGRLASVTHPDGVKQGYQYDVAGRLISEYTSEGGGLYAQKLYTYNSMSLPLSEEIRRVSFEPAQGTVP